MFRSFLLCALLLLLTACSDPAQKKFETAQFEEQQFNRSHAIELYQEIIASHPDSDYARKAAERLAVLKQEPATRSN